MWWRVMRSALCKSPRVALYEAPLLFSNGASPPFMILSQYEENDPRCASLLFVAAGMAYGGVPAVNVTVSMRAAKPPSKARRMRRAPSRPLNLKPGNYVVQFNSTSGAVKGNLCNRRFRGKKKVSAARSRREVRPWGRGHESGCRSRLEHHRTSRGGSRRSEEWQEDGLDTTATRQPHPGHWVEEGSAEAVAAKNAGTSAPGD